MHNFNFGNRRLVLAVLVNPANIVALPESDHSKIRTCEYYPYAVMSVGNEEWEEIEVDYFEEDYCDYEEENLQNLIDQIESDEDLGDDECFDIIDRVFEIYS